MWNKCDKITSQFLVRRKYNKVVMNLTRNFKNIYLWSYKINKHKRTHETDVCTCTVIENILTYKIINTTQHTNIYINDHTKKVDQPLTHKREHKLTNLQIKWNISTAIHNNSYIHTNNLKLEYTHNLHTNDRSLLTRPQTHTQTNTCTHILKINKLKIELKNTHISTQR